MIEAPQFPLRDAATDGESLDANTKRDAATKDVFVPITDAAGISIPGEWVETGNLPASCGLRTLKNPQVIPSFPWRSCSNGVVGCETFTADWEERGVSRAFSPSTHEPAFEDDAGVVRVTYERGIKFNDAFDYQVVQPMNGPAEAALSVARAGCGMLAQSSRYGLAAAIVSSVEAQSYLAWGTLEPGGSMNTVAMNLTPSLFLYQAIVRGDGFLAVEATNFGGPIVGAAFKTSDRTFFGPTATHTLENEQPRPVAGGYVALLNTQPPVVGFVSMSSGYQVLARPSVGHTVSSLTVDRKQNALVWTEGSSDDQHTFWTSPMATSEAGMQPRKVARAPITAAPVANAGVVLTLIGERQGRLVRISDGLGWDIPPEADLLYLQALWVNDDSVWILASKLYSGGAPSNSVVRFSRASLGPPTVPTGL